MPSLSDIQREQITALSTEEKVILLLMLESQLEMWNAVADDIRHMQKFEGNTATYEPWRLDNKIFDLRALIKLIHEQLEQLPKTWIEPPVLIDPSTGKRVRTSEIDRDEL